jgi:cell division protein FtsI/penicillin-binding protein 2
MDLVKIVTHDYNDISELSTEELKVLISEIINIDEVPFALDELYKRDADLAIQFAKEILERNLGDEYLKAAVVDFFFENNKSYMNIYIEKYINTMEFYVYKTILENVLGESTQSFKENLPGLVLKNFSKRYYSYNESKRKSIKDQYDLFTKSLVSKD